MATAAESFCAQTLQMMLVNEQRLGLNDATGEWNSATEQALDVRLPGWRSIPGGPCAIVAKLQLSGSQPAGALYVAPGAAAPSVWDQPLAPLAVGAGVLLLIVMLASSGKKK